MTVLKVVKLWHMTTTPLLNCSRFRGTINHWSNHQKSKSQPSINRGTFTLDGKWRKPLKSTTETCVVLTNNTRNIIFHQHTPWCLRIRTLCHVSTMVTCTDDGNMAKNHHIMMLWNPLERPYPAMQPVVKIWRLTTSVMVILMDLGCCRCLDICTLWYRG